MKTDIAKRLIRSSIETSENLDKFILMEIFPLKFQILMGK